jgi:hypothetical protein
MVCFVLPAFVAAHLQGVLLKQPVLNGCLYNHNAGCVFLKAKSRTFICFCKYHIA